MRAVTVSPFGDCPDSSRSAPGFISSPPLDPGQAQGKQTPSGATGEVRSVFDKALEFEARWTRNRVALPTELGPWTDKCMTYYADFTVTFTREGFDVRRRSDFATDEILTAVIALAADIHNDHKKPYGD